MVLTEENCLELALQMNILLSEKEELQKHEEDLIKLSSEIIVIYILKNKFPDGATEEEIETEMNMMFINKGINNLIVDGFIEEELTEDNEVVYSLTELGKNAINQGQE